MKHTTSMYKHETFDLAKKLGRHPYGIEGRGPKTYEKIPKSRFFGLISNNFLECIQNFIIDDTLSCTGSLFPSFKEIQLEFGPLYQENNPK